MIEIKMTGIDNLIKYMDPQVLKKAIGAAIKKAASTGKTEISTQIRSKFNVKKADLDSKISVDLNGIKDLKARLTISGSPINMTHFNPQQINSRTRTFISKDRGLAQKQTKRASKFAGVNVKIQKGKTTRISSAFISIGKGDVLLVFRRVIGSQSPNAPASKRTGKPWKREKLEAMKVISYTTILKQSDNMSAVENKILAGLKKEWEHNVKHFGSSI